MQQQLQRLNHEALMASIRQRETPPEGFDIPFLLDDVKFALYNFLKAEVARRNCAFNDSTETLRQVEAVATWLKGIGRRFGLVLCGSYGNGKTTMLRAIQSMLYGFNLRSDDGYRKWQLRVVSAMEIRDMVLRNDDAWHSLKHCDMLAIDDVDKFGDREVKSYGNVIDPISDIIAVRYERRLITILSTNLEPKALGRRFDGYIRDRFQEMMEILEYTNPSYRLAD